MIRTIPILMFATVILNASSGCLRSAPQLIPSSTQGTDAPSQASPDVARMEQVVQTYVSNKQFMGSVLVAHGDDILFNKGYGFANIEWEIPLTGSCGHTVGKNARRAQSSPRFHGWDLTGKSTEPSGNFSTTTRAVRFISVPFTPSAYARMFVSSATLTAYPHKAHLGSNGQP
jgi:hypothetical protein